MLRLAIIVAVVVIIASFWLASITGEPDWCNRGGALLAAIAALMAIFDAATEYDFRQGEIRNAARRSSLVGDDDTNVSLVNRIIFAKFKRNVDSLSYNKWKAVFWISSIAVAGELFHGFGDMIYVGIRALVVMAGGL